MENIVPQKRCSKCKEKFPATLQYFHTRKEGRDHLTSQCKRCRSAYSSNRHRTHHYPINFSQGFKRCSTCKQEKPANLEYFHADTCRPDGFNSQCKKCKGIKKEPIDVEHQGMRRCSKCKEWKPATLDFFGSDPVVKCGLLAMCKICRPQHRQVYIQQYYKVHAQDIKHHRQTNKEAVNAIARNRIARKKSIPGTHTAEQIREQYDRQKGKCYYCRNKVKWGEQHVDHTFPISREGARNSIDHLVIACKPCNLKKHDRYPWEFFEGGRLL